MSADVPTLPIVPHPVVFPSMYPTANFPLAPIHTLTVVREEEEEEEGQQLPAPLQHKHCALQMEPFISAVALKVTIITLLTVAHPRYMWLALSSEPET